MASWRFSWLSALAGILAVLALGAIGAYAVVAGGYAPINADAKPSGFEKHWAMLAVHRTVDRLAPTGDVPFPADDRTLTAGAHLYEQNCSMCHGAAAGRPATIGAGLYQEPPQFARHGVDDDPAGETYWKIRHGIRFTGMPAFTHSLSDADIWKIALFLKNLPKLPPQAEAAWKTMRVPGQIMPGPTARE